MGSSSSDEELKEQVQVQPSSRVCERVSGGDDDDSSGSSDEDEEATDGLLDSILDCYICHCKSDKVL